MNPNDFEYLRYFINNNCIVRAPQGAREMTSLAGNVSRWQFYLRAATLDPFCLNIIATRFWELYLARYNHHAFQIAGVDASALPIMAAIIMHGYDRHGIRLHAFSIRKDRKSYGIRNIFEGVPDKNLPVMFVDDLSSPTHLTFWHTVNQLTLHGLQLHPSAFVLVYKADKTAERVVPTSHGPVAFDAVYCLDDLNMTWEEALASSRDVLAVPRESFLNLPPDLENSG